MTQLDQPSQESSRGLGAKFLDWLPAIMIIAGLIWDASASKEQTAALGRDVTELRADMKEVREDVAILKGKAEK